jgi:hypothetical protein
MVKKIIFLFILSAILFYLFKSFFSSSLFHHTFSNYGYNWKSVKKNGTNWQVTNLAPSQGFIRLEEPFWIDTNHIKPGIGPINLIFYNYINDIFLYPLYDTYFSPKIFKKVVIAFSNNKIDLYNRVLTIKASLNSVSLGSSQIYFWFQSKSNDGIYSNYFYNHPINLIQEKVAYSSLAFSDQTKWVCLGSSKSRASYYGCSPLSQNAAECNLDFGLIIYPALQPPNNLFEKKGFISIYEIRLD